VSGDSLLTLLGRKLHKLERQRSAATAPATTAAAANGNGVSPPPSKGTAVCRRGGGMASGQGRR